MTRETVEKVIKSTARATQPLRKGNSPAAHRAKSAAATALRMMILHLDLGSPDIDYLGGLVTVEIFDGNESLY